MCSSSSSERGWRFSPVAAKEEGGQRPLPLRHTPQEDSGRPPPLSSSPPPHRRFFRSPNFDGWYRQRHKEMTHQLEALHLEAISEAVSGEGQSLQWGQEGGRVAC